MEGQGAAVEQNEYSIERKSLIDQIQILKKNIETEREASKVTISKLSAEKAQLFKDNETIKKETQGGKQEKEGLQK